MIGRLNGVLLEKQAPHLLLDISGVGYDVQAPMTTFYHLPDLGQPVVLSTHFAVSETSQQLYGFISRRDRDLFRQLIRVNGIGPKMAIGIMSMESDDFVQCVMDDNIQALVKVPGVGKKTAERIVIDMRDKLKSWDLTEIEREVSGDAPARAAPSALTKNTIVAEAEGALVALGYRPAEAAKSIAAVYDESVTRTEELIRLALRAMLPA